MAATIGVLIDIPQPHCAVLQGWRSRVGDPLAGAVPPHVTLLPPTVVDADDLDKIEAHLDQASSGCRTFPMHLSGTGTFRPVSEVVFVQVARGIGECELLADAIRSGPLDRQLDFPYHPHVTVAQDLESSALDAAYDGLSAFSARFVVSDFTLYEQQPDGWRPRRHFGLAPV